MDSAYAKARRAIEEGLKSGYLLLKATSDVDEPLEEFDEDGTFEIDEDKAYVGRWVIFFETTAPSRHLVDGESHFTFAKGFFCISSDGADGSMQEWEIRGMMDYAADKDIFG
jgi:hypothetical protein